MWLVQVALVLGVSEEVISADSYGFTHGFSYRIWLIKNAHFPKPAVSDD